MSAEFILLTFTFVACFQNVELYKMVDYFADSSSTSTPAPSTSTSTTTTASTPEITSASLPDKCSEPFGATTAENVTRDFKIKLCRLTTLGELSAKSHDLHPTQQAPTSFRNQLIDLLQEYGQSLSQVYQIQGNYQGISSPGTFRNFAHRLVEKITDNSITNLNFELNRIPEILSVQAIVSLQVASHKERFVILILYLQLRILKFSFRTGNETCIADRMLENLYNYMEKSATKPLLVSGFGFEPDFQSNTCVEEPNAIQFLVTDGDISTPLKFCMENEATKIILPAQSIPICGYRVGAEKFSFRMFESILHCTFPSSISACLPIDP